MAWPSQEFHLPRGSRELAWALSRRPETSKALPHSVPLFFCSDSELGVVPLQHSSVPPPSHPRENTWARHCCSLLSDLRSLLVRPGDLSAVPEEPTQSTLSLS